MDHRTFVYKVDRFFTVKNATEVLKSKKQTKIVVSLNLEAKKMDYPLTGKLTITCAEDERKDIKWVFYLQSEL